MIYQIESLSIIEKDSSYNRSVAISSCDPLHGSCWARGWWWRTLGRLRTGKNPVPALQLALDDQLQQSPRQPLTDMVLKRWVSGPSSDSAQAFSSEEGWHQHISRGWADAVHWRRRSGWFLPGRRPSLQTLWVASLEDHQAHQAIATTMSCENALYSSKLKFWRICITTFCSSCTLFSVQIHPLCLLPPPRCKTRFHKGWSYQTLTYKLLENTLQGGHLKFWNAT